MATCTLQAGHDGNWNTALNWDNVPGPNDDVIIPAGTAAITTPPSGALTIGTLTVANGARNTLTNLTVTGATSLTHGSGTIAAGTGCIENVVFNGAVTATISGGTFSGRVTLGCTYNAAANTITVTGGTWNNVSGVVDSGTIAAGKTVTVALNGGTIAANTSLFTCASTAINGTLTITNGGMTVNGQVFALYGSTVGTNGVVNIPDGQTIAISGAGSGTLVCAGNNLFTTPLTCDITGLRVTCNGNVALCRTSYAPTLNATTTITIAAATAKFTATRITGYTLVDPYLTAANITSGVTAQGILGDGTAQAAITNAANAATLEAVKASLKNRTTVTFGASSVTGTLPVNMRPHYRRKAKR
jgi:hypothetical protein